MKPAVLLVSLLGFAAFVKFTAFSHAGVCESLELETLQLIESSRSCSQDSDCVLQGFNCPFDCFVSVRRDRADKLRFAAQDYSKQCMQTCPQCPNVANGQPRCVQQICVTQ